MPSTGERIVGGLISERNLVGVSVGLLQDGEPQTATQLYEESGRAVAEQLFAQLTRSEQPVPLRGMTPNLLHSFSLRPAPDRAAAAAAPD